VLLVTTDHVVALHNVVNVISCSANFRIGVVETTHQLLLRVHGGVEGADVSGEAGAGDMQPFRDQTLRALVGEGEHSVEGDVVDDHVGGGEGTAADEHDQQVLLLEGSRLVLELHDSFFFR